jgi:prefoldin subunit 5
MDRKEEIAKLESKATALQSQAQELNQKLQQINTEFIKAIGAIEYLKGLKDEA